MKKVFLAICCLIFIPSSYSQIFTIPSDTVTRVVTGSDNLHNNITNISSLPLQVTWNVVAHDLPPDWAATFAICDNNLCYSSSSNILTGVPKTTGDIAAGTTANFYALIDLSIAVPGTHYAKVRMQGGGQVKDSWYIITRPPGLTAVPTYSIFNEQVVIYPNPSVGSIKVLFSTDLNVKTLIITDVSGKMIRKLESTGSVIDLDTHDLVAGIYLIKLLGENGRTIAVSRFNSL